MALLVAIARKAVHGTVRNILRAVPSYTQMAKKLSGNPSTALRMLTPKKPRVNASTTSMEKVTENPETRQRKNRSVMP